MTLRPNAHHQGGAPGDSAFRRINPNQGAAPILGSQPGVSALSAFRSGAFPSKKLVFGRIGGGVKGRFPAGKLRSTSGALPAVVTSNLIDPFYV
jgi:hypothetical protein